MKGNDKQKTKGCFLHIAWCDLLNECQAEKNVRLELQDFCYWHTDEHFLPPKLSVAIQWWHKEQMFKSQKV